jgi:hypothetical protein
MTAERISERLRPYGRLTVEEHTIDNVFGAHSQGYVALLSTRLERESFQAELTTELCVDMRTALEMLERMVDKFLKKELFR